MGKSGYKKFKKSEKAKVKLKGNKALLPKGQNVTNTNFKVKKIQIQNQLSVHDAGELLSKKKLNIKELLSRLGHHNKGMRRDALAGLREVLQAGLVSAHLASLVNGAARLVLDREADIRVDANQLLADVFDKMPLTQLSPLLPSLLSYCVCAMSHIERPIREDSLRLLDTVVEHAPHHSAPLLLNPTLALLTTQRTASVGRATLSLQLNSKSGAERWRVRVLARIRTLLAALGQGQTRAEEQEVRTVHLEKESYQYIPLYPTLEPDVSTSVSIHDVSLEKTTKLDVKDFAETLIPILLDSFVEAVPLRDKQNAEEANLVVGAVITPEAGALLQCVVDIIQLLWDLLEQEDSGSHCLTDWLRERFGGLVHSRLVADRFPYSVVVGGRARKRKRAGPVGTLLSETSCLAQNIALARLVVLFEIRSARKPVITYFKNSLRSGKLSAAECERLVGCLRSQVRAAGGSGGEGDAAAMLGPAARLGRRTAGVDTPLARCLFDFLVEVALDPSLRHLQTEHHFEAWLASLPALLTKETVPYETVRAITRIAPRNLPAFALALRHQIEVILNNLPNLEVCGCSVEEGERLVAGLMYWVQDWDHETLTNISRGIANSYWGHEATADIVAMLRLKKANDLEGSLTDILDSSDWWKDLAL